MALTVTMMSRRVTEEGVHCGCGLCRRWHIRRDPLLYRRPLTLLHPLPAPCQYRCNRDLKAMVAGVGMGRLQVGG